jgi:UDP-N-acetylmuramoyl-L-alanyl-D-glutamate--2,6-diaminopimelate ligase
VDYAHTPDARKRIETINDIRTKKRTANHGVGCGGNRDKTKRPIMAEASNLSNKVVLTSDNPRNEDPDVIILKWSWVCGSRL